MTVKTTTVGRQKLEVQVDVQAGLEYIESYDYETNPRELNVQALEAVWGMKERLVGGGTLTVKQLAYAKALFMKMIVPVDPKDVVKTIKCVHTEVVDHKMVRCQNMIEGSRAELAEWGSLCDEHGQDDS